MLNKFSGTDKDELYQALADRNELAKQIREKEYLKESFKRSIANVDLEIEPLQHRLNMAEARVSKLLGE